MYSYPATKKVFVLRALVRAIASATDATGNYFIRQLPAGVEYSIRVSTPQGGASTERLNLSVGQQAQQSPAINRNINDVIQQDPRIYVGQSSSDDSIQCNGANPRFKD